MIIAGPDEKYLRAVLEQRSQQVDDLILCGNNADYSALAKEFGFWFVRDDREWGVHQPRIKRDLLDKVGKLKPDWVLASDADEIFNGEFDRDEINRLADTGAAAYQFSVINLWDDEEHWRPDTLFQNVRFFNYRCLSSIPGGLDWERKPVHPGLAPKLAYKYACSTPHYFLHYGLMSKEDRLRKAERYNKYDPGAVFKGREYYDKLTDDFGGTPLNRDKLFAKLSHAYNTYYKDRETTKHICTSIRR